MPLPDLAREFLAWLRDSVGRAESTVKTYSASLGDFFTRMGIADPTAVTLRDLDRYAGRLGLAGLAINTRRNRLNALKSFFVYLHPRGHVSSNPAARLSVPRPRNLRQQDIVSTSEAERLVFACSTPFPVQQPKEPVNNFERRKRLHPVAEARDAAVLGVLYTLALRPSEIRLLERRDFQSSGNVRVLILRGAKYSDEPIALRLDKRIEALLDIYLLAVQRERILHPALFPPLGAHRGPEKQHGIGAQKVRQILLARIRAGGIETKGRRLSGHTLRRSRATHAYEAGMPLLEIQSLLRHRSLETTRRYIRLATQATVQKRAIASLPWNARRLRVAMVEPDS